MFVEQDDQLAVLLLELRELLEAQLALLAEGDLTGATAYLRVRPDVKAAAAVSAAPTAPVPAAVAAVLVVAVAVKAAVAATAATDLRCRLG